MFSGSAPVLILRSVPFAMNLSDDLPCCRRDDGNGRASEQADVVDGCLTSVSGRHKRPVEASSGLHAQPRPRFPSNLAVALTALHSPQNAMMPILRTLPFPSKPTSSCLPLSRPRLSGRPRPLRLPAQHVPRAPGPLRIPLGSRLRRGHYLWSHWADNNSPLGLVIRRANRDNHLLRDHPGSTPVYRARRVQPRVHASATHPGPRSSQSVYH